MLFRCDAPTDVWHFHIKTSASSSLRNAILARPLEQNVASGGLSRPTQGSAFCNGGLHSLMRLRFRSCTSTGHPISWGRNSNTVRGGLVLHRTMSPSLRRSNVLVSFRDTCAIPKKDDDAYVSQSLLSCELREVALTQRRNRLSSGIVIARWVALSRPGRPKRTMTRGD